MGQSSDWKCLPIFLKLSSHHTEIRYRYILEELLLAGTVWSLSYAGTQMWMWAMSSNFPLVRRSTLANSMYASQSKGVFKENLFVFFFSSGSLDLIAFILKNLERMVSIGRLPRMLLRSCLYRQWVYKSTSKVHPICVQRLHMFQSALGHMLRRWESEEFWQLKVYLFLAFLVWCVQLQPYHVARSTNKGYDVFLRDIIEPLEFIGLKAWLA